MARLEDLTRGALVTGVVPGGPVSVVDVITHGSNVVELTYKDATGKLGSELLYRDNEPALAVIAAGRSWSFDGDAALFRLVSEAKRIQLAHLFDPMLAVHTSLIEPLPHQITAVYGEMLLRQPLRFLLADDPGAGKTIMAGLLIRELIVRGDLRRCLICCPGSLVDQWQDELSRKFGLPFDIITGASVDESRSGNPFAEKDLVIARLDHLSRNEEIQARLQQTDWDLIVCDEAHKMAASFFGGEVKETKRYKLGRLLGGITRHFLLMTATPHNGKEEDFQLFLALLDGDRFEGRFRDGAHKVDISDLMRRMVKEQLLKFDGTPLFPERRASTVTYQLSPGEAQLYAQVTDYVRDGMNRADRLIHEGQGRRGTVVGFALTVLQRRLASSPEAIYQSLRRRRERLERRLQEERLLKRGHDLAAFDQPLPSLGDDEAPEFDDELPSGEIEAAEELVVDQATAARTIAELELEIVTLRRLEAMARELRVSGTDRKWEELSRLLQGNAAMFDTHGVRRKLIIFTEHRDTLTYLEGRMKTLLGRGEAVVVIHGGLGREERRKAQELFTQEKDVLFLLATDAAGEGVNLQRANLLVNYDLPWNPNRLEQRFGRIHRIGQTEVCHLWNLLADETREGDVFLRLFQKLERERDALGGRVFDVLGTLFQETPLRQLLIEAIRYGDQPEVRERLFQVVDAALDRKHLTALLEEQALVHDAMDTSKVMEIREEMERASARRMQPHFIAGFFIKAFETLGGAMHEREPHRYEITRVPALLRNRDRQTGVGDPILLRYERITFEKELIAIPGKPVATFVCPGHPLLDTTIALILERHRDVLQRGAVLIDPTDAGTEPSVLFALEHAIQDSRVDRAGNRRLVSKRLQFVAMRPHPLPLSSGERRDDGARHFPSPVGSADSSPSPTPADAGNWREVEVREAFSDAGPAPYLDLRPPTEREQKALDGRLGVEWLTADAEPKVQSYAAEHLARAHLAEVRQYKEHLVERTLAAVKDRLTKEINYWDSQAEHLKLQEQAGKVNARLNAAMARRRADDLEARLQKRLTELEQERRLSPLPPVVVGGALVVPVGLLAQALGEHADAPDGHAAETARTELLAMQAVLAAERRMGYDPTDVSARKCGYDIESRIPGTGRLRFVEVKGRAAGAKTVTVTKNEILTALNKPEDYLLAVVAVDRSASEPCYVRCPFEREPDFSVVSVNYDLEELLARAARQGT